VDVYRHRLEQAGLRIRHGLQGRLMDTQQAVDDAGIRMVHRIQMRRQADGERVRGLAGQLAALNPMAVLRRGYAVVTDPDGRVLRSVRETAAGRAMVARMSDGAVDASVTRVRPAEARHGLGGQGHGNEESERRDGGSDTRF
jgi:exodeoxyribonuclease VII large subunit